MQELQNIKDSLRNILIAILLLPFLVLAYTMIDYLSGAIIHRGWAEFWLVGVLQVSVTPAEMLVLNFSYDLVIVVVFLLLPTLAMLAHGKCTKSATALIERFVLLEVPVLVLWHVLFYFLLLSRMPTDVLVNGNSNFWRQVVSGSLAVRFLSLAIINGELGKSITIVLAKEGRKR